MSIPEHFSTEPIDIRAAERECILWAMLGVNNHTEASQEIARLIRANENYATENIQFRDKIALQEIAMNDICVSLNERDKEIINYKLLIRALEQRVADLRLKGF